VWSSTADEVVEDKTRTYKWVDITRKAVLSVTDTTKSLSKGLGIVAFKKRRVMKKNHGRITSADDD
jgi:hypothetical protein